MNGEFIIAINGEQKTEERDGVTVITLKPELREQIVRCRDCKHWQPWMKGAEPECWANGEPFSTPPDGFCAWGDRRGDAE